MHPTPAHAAALEALKDAEQACDQEDDAMVISMFVRDAIAALESTSTAPSAAEPVADRRLSPIMRKEDFDLSAFSEALTRSADARGKSMKDVAEETGVSETTLSRMRNEGRAPDAASLAALGSWAGINPGACRNGAHVQPFAAPPAPQPTGAETSAVKVPFKRIADVESDEIADMRPGRAYREGWNACREAVIAALKAEAPVAEPVAQAGEDRATLDRIGSLMGIGSQARSYGVIVQNIQNAMRRSDCLRGIESTFFMVSEPDEDDPDGPPFETCLLRWGVDRKEYVEDFRIALDAIIEQRSGNLAQSAAEDAKDGIVKSLLHCVDGWKASASDEESSGHHRVADAMRICAADLSRVIALNRSPSESASPTAVHLKKLADDFADAKAERWCGRGRGALNPTLWERERDALHLAIDAAMAKEKQG